MPFSSEHVDVASSKFDDQIVMKKGCQPMVYEALAQLQSTILRWCWRCETLTRYFIAEFGN